MSTLKEHQAILLELLIEFDRVCKKHDIKYVLFAGSALGAVRHQGFIPWDDDLDVALLREDYDRLMKLNPSEWDKKYYMQCEYSDHWPIHFSKLRKNNTTCLEKYHPKDGEIHQGIYIDIFPIDNASNNPIVRKMQFYASKIVQAKSFFKRGYETSSIVKKTVMILSSILPLKPFLKIVKMYQIKNSKYVHSFLGGSVNFKKGVFERRWIFEAIDMPFESITIPVSLHYHELLTMQYGDYMTLPPEDKRENRHQIGVLDFGE
jgi:lipopolysaccharide cholinephosphotransferase